MSAQRSLPAQTRGDTVRVSIVYTGRTFGALGVRQAQSEHELLTQQANTEGKTFKLVSHMSWRAPGVAIVLTGQEPQGDELAFVLEHRANAERRDSVPALVSANALLFQDPWRASPDLIAMLKRNPRWQLDFPDLVPTRISVSRLRTERDERVFIVEEQGAAWPRNARDWSVGEMNRIDLLDTRMFELPLNLGEIGPRATVVKRMREEMQRRDAVVLSVDLGHQQGDFGLAPPARAHVDFTALEQLGYSLLVPYEFELSLGADTLGSVAHGFPRIRMLAANVAAKDSTLFLKRSIVSAGGVRIGFTGLVNSTIEQRLPRPRLADFKFDAAESAVRKQVALLRSEGADAVVVLSNMDAPDNAAIAEQVTGIDAIIADLPERWAPEAVRTRVDLPDRPYSRPGAPVLIGKTAANGVAVGRLDLEFRRPSSNKGLFLSAVEHRVEAVTDRIPADTALVHRIAAIATPEVRSKGDLMFPAFVDLADRHPALRHYDATTEQGRVSEGMWEGFMARVLRRQASAEVAVIRRLEQFPPLIGKLHENEIGGWLWTQDEIVVLDVLGSDLKKLVGSDTRGELATSGIDAQKWTVQGHRIDDQTYYRLATVDVLYDGNRGIANGRRIRRHFRIGPRGQLLSSDAAGPLALKDFVYEQLRRVRTESKGDEQIDRLAALLAPDPPYANLLAFTFDRPTFWASLNQVQGGRGYGSVSESRVTAKDSWVKGVSGRFVLSRVGLQNTIDLGSTIAYARQGLTSDGTRHVSESADDLKFDLTFRPNESKGSVGRIRPFVRGLFDTEFTPTIDPGSGVANPRQLALRGSAGLMSAPRQHWRKFEMALALENDFGRPNLQFGFQTMSDLVLPIGLIGRAEGAQASYRLHNDATYMFPAHRDSPRDLALRYNMVHEIVVPLVDELSLTSAADFFFFQGKVSATHRPGMSVLLRIGLTYDRLWKPRYQPFL